MHCHLHFDDCGLRSADSDADTCMHHALIDVSISLNNGTVNFTIRMTNDVYLTFLGVAEILSSYASRLHLYGEF